MCLRKKKKRVEAGEQRQEETESLRDERQEEVTEMVQGGKTESRQRQRQSQRGSL